jgi:hypothetical protein
METGSPSELMDRRSFQASGLLGIVIPSSVKGMGMKVFLECKWPADVLFERGSRLKNTKESTFRSSGLQSMVISDCILA